MKTSNAPWMKRITMYICFIVVLCFFNLVAIKAQDPVKETPIESQQVESITDQTQMDQMKLQQEQERRSKIMQALANIMKKVSETTDSIVQNLK